MKKYRVGRKQKRVILNEKGHEVAIFHKKFEDEAQKCCDLMNDNISIEETRKDIIDYDFKR